MKRNTTLIFLLSFFIQIYPQYKLSGTICNMDNTPIESVSIRLKGFGIGVISDNKGNFTLLVPDSLLQNQITFSHINYTPIGLFISEIENKQFKVLLEPKDIELKEVSVISRQNKVKWLKSGSIYLGKTHLDVLGNEYGIMFDIKEKVLLKQIKFKIKECSYNNIPAYIRIYRYDKQNKELSDILFSQTIFIPIITEESDKGGKEYRIVIEDELVVNNEDIYVAIDYPKMEENGVFSIPAILGTGYSRKSGQTILIKKKFNQGLSLEVMYIK